MSEAQKGPSHDGRYNPTRLEARRRLCRRPISPEETEVLKDFGGALRAIRRAAGVGANDLATRAEMDRKSLWRIEVGARRTRASTLWRIATALAEAAPWLDAQEVTDTLVGIGGAGLAAESPYRPRVEARRARRMERRERQAEQLRRYEEWLRTLESFRRYEEERLRWEGRFLGISRASLSGPRGSRGLTPSA